ncbi:MAG: hypothetical protein KZQ60_00050 [Candidatus Thiodiazotropha sp. (ex Lucinoma aequizonata)]|nr:hypothetical protein [Candidatus Thiodiazotropha sp. (ex Lucinoma aequizonata)]
MNSFEYFIRVAISSTSVKSIVLNQSVHVYWATPILLYQTVAILIDAALPGIIRMGNIYIGIEPFEQ